MKIKKTMWPVRGNGYVDAYDTSGNLIRRVASAGELNSPWGLVLAPADFGRFSGDLLVGNFGDGRIHAFDPSQLTEAGRVRSCGLLHSAAGKPVKIDWSVGASIRSLHECEQRNGFERHTLFFTAGPAEEEHGLFGSLVNVAPPGRQ
jgi:uncharacterized protein (TIGR03118 family)